MIQITIKEGQAWLLDWALIQAIVHEERIAKMTGIEHPAAELCLERAQELEELRQQIFSDSQEV